MGVLFILVQPLFGMDTLTGRHAALYQQLGGWSAIPAMVMAWFVHLTVSVSYGLLSGIAVMTIERLGIVALLTVTFSWITTVIAPPANAIIVQLVSFQRLTGGDLPGLNFSIDERLLLHVLFFTALVGGLYFFKKKHLLES